MKAFLWVTDPWSTLDHASDTSLRLGSVGAGLGLKNFWCDVHSVYLERGKVFVRARAFVPGKGYELSPNEKARPLSDFMRVIYRTDPPVDLAYLHPLQILRMGESRTTEIVNPVQVLFERNEKLEGLALPGLAPPTLASASREELLRFGRAEGKAVLKPLHQAQSKGVELLDFASGVPLAALSQATDDFTRPALLQKFLPAIHAGEQRLWFLNGKLLAYVRKIPAQGEFKIDMDHGGRVAETSLTQKEKLAAQKIGRHLRALRIRHAAVDLIDGLITDFNFTSPGLIVQMERVTGENLAEKLVRSLAKGWG